eukprot:GEMP01003215.1.p1 GENE.GEMP01003215.1~~GEMP01003215.1.p1  ORF type:complete len:988 (+),score=183.20 GEMP01003215.1:200-3163(+)
MNVESLQRYIHQYVGKYIRVQTENIYISYTEGIFSIKQAEIRRDAFKDVHVFAVPRAGFVGNITVSVPSFFSTDTAVHIKMTDVLVIFTSYEHDWTPERVNEGRMTVLRLIDRAFQMKNKRKDDTSQKTASFLQNMKGWLFDYVKQLVKRHLIIEIKDVQVLYEGDVRSPQRYYFGLSLGRIVTTNPPLTEFHNDGLWINERDAKDEGTIWRANKIHIRRFHVFCDTKFVPNTISICDELMSFTMNDPEDFSYDKVVKEFRRQRVLEVFRFAVMQVIRKNRGSVRSRPAPYERHEFIIYPIECGTFELIRSAPGEGRPQFDWYLTLPLQINLTNTQMAKVLRFKRSRGQFGKNTEKLLYRPKVPVKGHARAWWYYASIMVSPKCRASFIQTLKHRARLRELFLQAKETGNGELLREVYLSLPYRVAVEYMMLKWTHSVANAPEPDEAPTEEPAVPPAPEVKHGDEVGPSRQLRVDISVEATLSVREPKFGVAYFTWHEMMSSNVVFILSIPRISFSFVERSGNFVSTIRYLELDIPGIKVTCCIPMMTKIKKLAVIDKITVQYNSNESGAQTKNTRRMDWLSIDLGRIEITAYAPLLRQLKSLFVPQKEHEVATKKLSPMVRLQWRTQKLMSKLGQGLAADISVGSIAIVLLDEYSLEDFACVRHETEDFSMQMTTSDIVAETNISIPWTTSMTLEKRSAFMSLASIVPRLVVTDPTTRGLTMATAREVQRLREVVTAGNAMLKLNHYGVWVKKYLRVVRIRQHADGEFLRYADSEDGKQNAKALAIRCVESVKIGTPPATRRSAIVNTFVAPVLSKLMDSEVANIKHASRILTIIVEGDKFYIFRAPTAQHAIWWRDGLKNAHIREMKRVARRQFEPDRRMAVRACKINRLGVNVPEIDVVKIRTPPPKRATLVERKSLKEQELLEDQSLNKLDLLILRPLTNQKSILAQIRSWMSRKPAEKQEGLAISADRLRNMFSVVSRTLLE